MLFGRPAFCFACLGLVLAIPRLRRGAIERSKQSIKMVTKWPIVKRTKVVALSSLETNLGKRSTRIAICRHNCQVYR